MGKSHQTLLDAGVELRTFRQPESNLYTVVARDGKSPLPGEQSTHNVNLDAALDEMLALATAAGWTGEAKSDKDTIADLAAKIAQHGVELEAAQNAITARDAGLAQLRQQAADAAAAIAAKDAELAELRKQLEAKAAEAAIAETATPDEAAAADEQVR